MFDEKDVHAFKLTYKSASAHSEGSETIELISRLYDLIKYLEDNNSLTHKPMVGETGDSSLEDEDIVQSI